MGKKKYKKKQKNKFKDDDDDDKDDGYKSSDDKHEMKKQKKNSRRESSTRNDITGKDGKGNQKRRANFQETTISTLILTTNSTTIEFDFFCFQNLGAIQFIQSSYSIQKLHRSLPHPTHFHFSQKESTDL